MENGHNAPTAARNVNTAFGEDFAKERNDRLWFERFRSGGHGGCGSASTVRKPAQCFGFDGITTSRYGKVKEMEKWIPHELTVGQMLKRHATLFR
ncbi:unnamed protein product [Heligmosomoides polygyrus]|uniref:HTH_48 domain-containing protein n=1 Tax=Heligmosomoides polygyrus TaxID=6339 RepID=A0A183FP28_HELPZ|nr:unnamed protein product [Heligmosomoides polygyrus]